MSDLEIIQRLQFSDRKQAQTLLQGFLTEVFPDLAITEVTLRPLATSLNSFNGFLKLQDHTELFFKTHVEQNNVIDEYYNAALLAEAGYPVIQPLYHSTRAGQQILIYPLVHDPPVFDLARALETDQDAPISLSELSHAQHRSDDQLLSLYLNNLAHRDETGNAPIHQLFYHRLTGGRLDHFYGPDRQITLPSGTYPLSEVRTWRWTINGSHYHETLDQVINRAITLLNPQRPTPTIIGHGDAHNGNVFYNTAQGLVYFDPAFAGRHDPLFDLTKPLFHNVFAMWMYFPQEESQRLAITMTLDGDHCRIEHNDTLNPIREMFLHSKIERVLKPLLAHLPPDSDRRSRLKAALFCCPFLTMNLTLFPPSIALLGLAMSVYMGSESVGQRSQLDHLFDRLTW
ncbi:MAG: aminoglycoside phosphotransferase family protein [Anaerolineae bacterium]|jgi:hypothetical protein|nr:aminoglycoside phosphotransferase family protein [Anaerolineae bacterium]